MARTPRPATTGIIIVDKPIGPTSMDVVRVVRRRAGGAKTGHAGTLDPLATGVLVVCLGKATKSVPRIMDTSKRYLAEIDLSAFTTTDDREGEAREIIVETPPDCEMVMQVLQSFVGDIQQKPPAFSAINIQGKRAYKLARKGEIVDIPARSVRIHDIQLLRYDWPMLTLDIHCGKGTYIRSLARDLGLALGTGGHLASLRRTAVGRFTIEKAIPLDDVPQPLTEENLISLAELEQLYLGEST